MSTKFIDKNNTYEKKTIRIFGLEFYSSSRIKSKGYHKINILGIQIYKRERKMTGKSIKVLGIPVYLKYFIFLFKSMLDKEGIRDNSVLLIETNGYHSELLPGISKYFAKLGYNVDVFLNPKEFDSYPFALCKDNKIRLFKKTFSDVQYLYQKTLFKKYHYVYHNSEKIGSQNDTAMNLFPLKDQKKNIFMCHHIDDISENETGKLITLGDYKCKAQEKPVVVVPTYYGEFTIRPKNIPTRFVVVGNIEKKRKNFELLLDTFNELIENTSFQCSVSVIARVGNLEISEKLKDIITFKGQLDHNDMYNEVLNSDFILALLDDTIDDHMRYVTKGFSGTILLSYGFRRPCIIQSTFAEAYGFNDDNSIIYSKNCDFADAVIRACNMSRVDYGMMQSNLSELVHVINNRSISELKKIVKDISK